MTTEILTLANSIAASKESIRQALVSRGVSCNTSVPLADYADKINNMVVSGSVDNLLVANYSGREIKAGDKIFIKPDRSTQTLNKNDKSVSDNGYGYSAMNPEGSIFLCTCSSKYYTNYLDYDYFTAPYNSSSTTVFYTTTCNGFVYDDYGQLWSYGNRNLNYCGKVYENLGNIVLGGKYSLECGHSYDGNFYNGTTGYVYEYNNHNEVVKTFNYTAPSGGNNARTRAVVVNNKILMNLSGGYCFYGDIPVNDGDTITFTSINNSGSIYPKGITSDGKYLICVSNYEYGTVFFIDITNGITDLSVTKTFNNNLMNTLCNVNCYMTYNPYNNVLCLTRSSATTSMADIGLFKYNPNTEDWDTITPDLSQYYADNIINGSYEKWITISNDETRMSFGRYIFDLNHTNSGGYNILSYGLRSSFENGVLTAIALEDCDAKAGSICNVKTIVG